MKPSKKATSRIEQAIKILTDLGMPKKPKEYQNRALLISIVGLNARYVLY